MGSTQTTLRDPPPLAVVESHGQGMLDLRALEPNALVRRAISGCGEAFAELSQRFRPRLLHLLQRRFGGCFADAEDVAQEALTKAFLRIELFDQRFSFSTWLYTLAFRLAHDQHRRRQTRERHVSIVATDCHHLPARVAASALEADNIWEAAERYLSDTQYLALWLRFGEDLSVAEIAQVMGKTRVGVRVLLHRARGVLLTSLSAGEVNDRRHRASS